VLTVSGSVDDVDEQSFRQAIAEVSGVSVERVLIEVAAASVLITATVLTEGLATDASDAVLTSLQTALSSSQAASEALGVTVESIDSAPVAMVVVAQPLDAPGDDGLDLWVIAVAGVGGAVALAAFAAARRWCCRNKQPGQKRLMDAGGRGIEVFGSVTPKSGAVHQASYI
jgi:hypothetical protein